MLCTFINVKKILIVNVYDHHLSYFFHLYMIFLTFYQIPPEPTNNDLEELFKAPNILQGRGGGDKVICQFMVYVITREITGLCL